MGSVKLPLIVVAIVLAAVGAAAVAAQSGPAKADQELLDEGEKLVRVHKYEAALERLEKVRRSALGIFERNKYDGLLQTARTGAVQKPVDEAAIDQGKAAMDARQYGTAMEKFTQAAKSNWLEDAKKDLAEGLLEEAKRWHANALGQAKDLLKEARQAARDGRTDEARRLLARIKGMDVRFALFDRWALSDLEKKVGPVSPAPPPAEVAAPAEGPRPRRVAAMEPAEEPAGAEMPPVRPIVQPAEEPAEEPAPPEGPMAALAEEPAPPEGTAMDPAEGPMAAPAEEPAPPEGTTMQPAAGPEAPAPPAEAEPVGEPAGVAAIRRTEQRLSIAEQARRAEAEQFVKLGEEAAMRGDWREAESYYRQAIQLWPGYERAQKGLAEAQRYLAEREESPFDVYGTQIKLQMQQIMSQVEELLNEANRLHQEAMRTGRPEDYAEALQPLAEADRVIDRATILPPEQAEALRERVFVRRNQIQQQRQAALEERQGEAAAEAARRIQERLIRDQQERERRIQEHTEQVKELTQSMRYREAILVLDRLIALDPENEWADLQRSMLLHLEAMADQRGIRGRRYRGQVQALMDVEEASIHPGEEVLNELRYLRYPDARTWEQLSKFRAELAKVVMAEPEAVAETRRRLQEKIDLDFERTSLNNVLQYISEVQRDLNIVIDPELEAAGIDLASRVVDLKLRRVSIESVLRLILGADLGYKVEPGYILVTTREKVQQNLPIVTYPVQDLIATVPDFGGQAPRFDVAAITQAAGEVGTGGGAFGDLFGGGAGAAGLEEDQVGWQELVDIITRNVNSLSDPSVAAWTDEGGPAAIDYMNGVLIITQTREGHQRVADLLDKLRRERAIMVSVESRFITVSDDFLQDITVDVDVTVLGSERFGAVGGLVQNPQNAQGFETLPGIGFQRPILEEFQTLTIAGVEADSQVFDIFGNPVGRIAEDPNLLTVGTDIGQSQPIIVGSTSSNSQGTSSLLNLAGTAFANFTATEGGLVVSGVFLDEVQVGFLLRAIQADVRSHQLFAPRITLFNGQRSYISVTTAVTYISDAEPVVSEAAVGFNPEISGIPVGATLDVKATVSADRRYVQLDLRPQVADITQFGEAIVQAAAPFAVAQTTIDLPIISVQDLKTTASVPDGGTLLLGGSKRMRESRVESGVPVLSKIPILKRLFDNRATVRTSENLLVMIKPKIIIQAEEEHKLGYDDL